MAPTDSSKKGDHSKNPEQNIPKGVSLIPMPVIPEEGEYQNQPSSSSPNPNYRFKGPYLYIVFSVFSQMNAVYCMIYLNKEIPKHFSGKEGGSHWRQYVMGFMDVFTFIRMLVQAISTVFIIQAFCSTSKRSTYRNLKHYIVATCFIAFEEAFSLCFNISRIAIEDMTFDELKVAMEYSYVIYSDLVFFSWGFLNYLCYVRPKYLESKPLRRYHRLEKNSCTLRRNGLRSL